MYLSAFALSAAFRNLPGGAVAPGKPPQWLATDALSGGCEATATRRLSGSEGGPAYLSRGVTTGSVPDNVGQGRRSSAQRSGKGASSQAGQSASQEQTQDTTNTGKDDPEPTDPDGQPQPGDPDYDPLAPLRPILEQALEAQKNRPPQSDPPLPNR